MLGVSTPRLRRIALAPQVGLEPTTLRLTAEGSKAASRCKHKTAPRGQPCLSHTFKASRSRLDKPARLQLSSPTGLRDRARRSRKVGLLLTAALVARPPMQPFATTHFRSSRTISGVSGN